MIFQQLPVFESNPAVAHVSGEVNGDFDALQDLIDVSLSILD